RFGPYIRHNSAFYSLPKGVDPLDVTEEEAIQIIKDKRQKDKLPPCQPSSKAILAGCLF
ncbi:topoisomerase C-terminal repeat-containing protein, partial [Sphingobacterium paramultivorum]|uniref:topoisomerase C-terminal repeat-containing protein n=1 Tax=Sphingobacterium paramultivorum TaxID=2886510 RepID=UPI00129C4A7B